LEKQLKFLFFKTHFGFALAGESLKQKNLLGIVPKTSILFGAFGIVSPKGG
jgi:hypothetical protein